MPQNPSALKRQKELARLDWQKEKAERRKQRKAEKEAAKLDPTGHAQTDTSDPHSP